MKKIILIMTLIVSFLFSKEFKVVEKKCLDEYNVSSCLQLAQMYLDGNGVKKNVLKGLMLLESLAKMDNEAGAMLSVNIGAIYQNGDGIKQDYPKAIKYYKKACDGNISMGCSNLATMYLQGWGAKRDKIKALNLFKKSCKLGGESSCRYVEVVENKKIIPSTQKNIQKKYLQFNTRDWKTLIVGMKNMDMEMIKKVADQGNDLAMFVFAEKNRNTNPKLSIPYYEKLAAKNISLAQFRLFVIYKDLNNEILKMTWLKKAAYNNNEKAKFVLAVKYLNGENIEKNYKKAAQLIHDLLNSKTKLIAEGAKNVWDNDLHKYYIETEEDILLEKWIKANFQDNEKKSFLLAKELAAKNITIGKDYLASYYFSGKGTVRNVSESMYWAEQAILDNSNESILILILLYLSEVENAKAFNVALKGIMEEDKLIGTLVLDSLFLYDINTENGMRDWAINIIKKIEKL